MPALSSHNEKILVTGANGFIATWVIRTLLERGYAVRGTVRSENKGKYLSKLFAEFDNRFEYVIVKDITEEGAFDEAVKGVTAIEHTASPVTPNVVDPQELIKPAVQGTMGVLQSALKFGPSVQRVVITSSTAAILSVLPEPKVFTEEDWGDQAVEAVNEQGSNAASLTKYRASKTLAEKAAWDFVETNKDKINWDLVVINPPFVFGPVIHEVSDVASLNASNMDWYKAIVTGDIGGISDDILSQIGVSWVDVRDLAESHVLALEKEEAGGERIIVSAGREVWQNWLDTANALSSVIPSHKLRKGNPDAKRDYTRVNQYSAAKADRIFGIKYRSKEECARDMLADFEKRGW